MKKLLLLVMVVSLAGVVGAASIWVRPTTEGPGNWNDPANWDVAEGVPTVDTAVTNLGANANNLSEAQVTDAQTFGTRIRIGTNSAGGVLRIMDGGTLSSGNSPSRSYIGDAFDGKMIIEEGGTFAHGHRLYIGDIAGVTGTVDVYGTLNFANNVYVGGRLEDGTPTGGIGRLNVRGNGVVNLSNFNDTRIPVAAGSVVDLSANGKLVCPVNNLTNSELLAKIAGGRIVGYGVLDNVIVSYDGTYTTVAAGDDPLDRLPEYDAVVHTGSVDLSWINLAPVAPATDVYIDVWYGSDTTWVMPTDANLPGDYADFAKVVDAELGMIDDDGVTVPAPLDNQEYIWRVDTYRHGDPNVVYYGPYPDDGDPNTSEEVDFLVDEGIPMVFTAVVDLPPSVIMDTAPTATWKNEPVQLDITVTDDAESDVYFLWEASDPNAVFKDPGTGLEIVLETVEPFVDYTLTEDPTVEIDYACGPFNVTVTASDSNLLGITSSASVELDSRDDECSASRLGLELDLVADIDEDCAVGLSDIAMLAAKWASGYAAPIPFVTP